MITIKTVVTKGNRRDFVRVPFDIYKHDDNWVAPLRAEEYRKLDIKRNPFYKHAQAQFFIAREGRKPVGRIAAIVDHLFEDYHGEKVAYWVCDGSLIRKEVGFQCEYDLKRGMEETSRWYREMGWLQVYSAFSFTGENRQ